MSESKLSDFHLQSGGSYRVFLGYREDRLDSFCIKGKFLVHTLGGVMSTLYQGRQVRVVARVRTPRGLRLTTETCRSAKGGHPFRQ